MTTCKKVTCGLTIPAILRLYFKERIKPRKSVEMSTHRSFAKLNAGMGERRLYD